KTTTKPILRSAGIMANDKSLFRTALIVLLASAAAFGQTTTGTVSGVIRDGTGAIVPDAKITATNAQIGTARETTTDSQGPYSIPNLGPGQYNVRAERTGFQTAVQNGVILAVGGATVVDLTLQVGTVSEVVQVTSEEVLVETTKAELSRVVDEISI